MLQLVLVTLTPRLGKSALNLETVMSVPFPH
jgi:hypothetical protein